MRFRRALVISVLAALALYAGSSLFTGAEDVLGAISRVDVRVWILVLGLSLLNYSLRFCRWQWYLVRLGHVLPPFRHLAYYVAGFAFTTTPGKVGEAVRSVYLRPYGVGYADSLAALFAERFLDLLTVLLLGLLIARSFTDVWWSSVCAAVLIVVILTTLAAPGLRSAITVRLGGGRSPRVRRLGVQVHSLMLSAEALLSWRMLLGGVALGLIAWIAEGAGFYLILRDLDMEVSAPVAIGVYAAGMLIGALSFIPGGLGSTEAAMVLMLTVLGMEVTGAIAATIICRVATLWFAVALGFCAIACAEAGRERTVNPG
jgi:uncharacterized membrane protein YbhN (UPF0104 family)